MNIKELKEITKLNVPITGTFVLSKCELKPFAAKGGYFLQCQLTDLTGSLKGIVWDGAEAIKGWVRNKMVVDVVGEITRYNDMPQVIIKTLKQKKEYNRADFLPSLPADKIRAMLEELNLYKMGMKNDTCKLLWGVVVPETKPGICEYDHRSKISEKFIQCPGGVGEVHHNYLGGLLEHAYGMIRTAVTVAEYATLDRDILLTGCLLHDIGKIDAYNYKIVLEMTDTGRLLHHTTIGFSILKDLATIIPGIPKLFTDNEIMLKLAHIIISHHEEEGFRKPMFSEAQAVSALDKMDAAVQHAIMFSGKPENHDSESNWTRFCSLTERQYFMPMVQSIPIEEPKEPLSTKNRINTESIL
jgi:3'-5' exoribonuclease